MKIATATTTVCLIGFVNPGCLAAAVPETVQHKPETGAVRGAIAPDRVLTKRDLFETHIDFPECVGKTMEVCEAIIQAEAAKTPELFGGEAIVFDVRYKRQRTDDDYNLVVLRMDEDHDHVAGTNGDGLVDYPWTWRTLVDGVWEDVEIGPWDCDLGTPLTAVQCCDFIKSSVPNPDDQGNYLDCFQEPKEVHDPSHVLVFIDPTTGTVVEDLIPKVA